MVLMEEKEMEPIVHKGHCQQRSPLTHATLLEIEAELLAQVNTG